MDIEVPRRLLSFCLYISLILAPLWLGHSLTPQSESGQPLLLTPRRASIQAYHRSVQAWTIGLEQIGQELEQEINNPSGELFTQNEHVNRSTRHVSQILAEMEQTRVPETFAGLHEQLTQTGQICLDTAGQAARWISEPTEENFQSAQASLVETGRQLLALRANPWIGQTP